MTDHTSAELALARVPPHSERVERAILGACLTWPEAVVDVAAEAVSAADFYVEGNRAIFEALLALSSAGSGIDCQTVGEALRSRGHLDRVGGASYLDQCLDDAPVGAQVQEYARIVRDHARRRAAILGAAELQAAAWSEADPVALSSMASRLACAVLPPANRRTPAEILGELLDGQEADTVDLPLGSLGRQIGPLFGGQKVIVAARTSVGKTALLAMLWLSCAAHRIPAAYLSCEDSEEEIVARSVGGLAWLSWGGVLARRWTAEARAQGVAIRRWMADQPLSVAYLPGAQREEVGVAIRQAVARQGARVVIVDYVQAIGDNGRDGRNQQIVRILRELSRAAGRDAVLVVGSQLSRPTTKGSDVGAVEPSLHDLRDSGVLEEDARVVLMLQRDGAAQLDARGAKVTQPVRIHLAKNKAGETGVRPGTLWLRHSCLWPGTVRPRLMEQEQEQRGVFDEPDDYQGMAGDEPPHPACGDGR